MHVSIVLLCATIFMSGCFHTLKLPPAQSASQSRVGDVDGSQHNYYLTTPQQESFPIAVLCEGSTSTNDVESVWAFHQFDQFSALTDMGIGIVTVEKDGIDGDRIDRDKFLANYMRSKRLQAHVSVIDHLLANPPRGFDGRLIFIGVSEGGSLVNQLSIHYPQTIATINWSGASAWSWADELWAWCEQKRKDNPFVAKLYSWWHQVPRTRNGFDDVMTAIANDPTHQRFFLGMTHRYHADALAMPALAYHKIYAPMLVVCGRKDSLINSCDAFVEKLRAVRAPVTYWRVDGMEHRISRNKENLIPRSFDWLRKFL